MRSHEDFRHGGSLGPIQVCGNWSEMVLGNRYVLCLARASDNSENAIADAPATNLVTDLFNFTGELNARNLLWITMRRRIASLSLQDVRAIQSGRTHVNAHAIKRRARSVGHVANFQAFNAAERSDCYSAHQSVLRFQYLGRRLQWATARTKIVSLSIR